MSSVLKKATDLPKKAVTEAGSLVKEIAKPATTKRDSRLVALGTILSAPISFLYVKFFDAVGTKIPFMSNKYINLGIRVCLPFGLAYLFKRFKLPFGTLVNGVLYGVGITQVLSAIWDTVAGKVSFSLPSIFSKKKIVPGENESNSNGYAEWD